MNTKTAEVYLPYFKQGDDMHSSLVQKEDGSIDARKSISNHIELLQASIDKLHSIYDRIPEVNDVSITGDTHCIWITGSEEFINKLITDEICEKNLDSDDESAEAYDCNHDFNNIDSCDDCDNSNNENCDASNNCDENGNDSCDENIIPIQL